MDSDIELVSDGDGLAVIGDPAAIERFLADEGLQSKALALPRVSTVVGGSAAGLQAGSQIAESSGRWVKLTAESAAQVKKYGLTPTGTPGVDHAMLGARGNIKGWIQIAKGPGSIAANPAILAGGAGVMAQLALQQTMSEVTDYLVKIDAKLDDVLRAQKNAVVAPMIGVGLQLEEAMTIREHVGRVNEVTWSKIQATSGTVADTQAYALLQLDALASKFEQKSKVGDLTKVTKEIAPKVREWLAVLARCFQLLDAIAVLELDRVLETAPEDADGYRTGIRAARMERREAISRSTGRLLGRLGEAVAIANAKVLTHPSASPAIVQISDRTADAVDEFHQLLGIEEAWEDPETRLWGMAATEVKVKAVAAGVGGVGAVKRFSSETGGRAREARGRIANRVAERSGTWRSRDDESDGID
ncbi:hypothetical protein [Nocardioides jishulii]|uniref:Uncharacterized protein n=1 Tax=Nocardioides jishulii TaxID=2575440 RepID=A0A4U2YMN9_9ACTN|nr:hypothetical protein [Nocardioides jishulii]QCX27723.1 hypothetical protein FCL41_09435 [Nocardioides jishulii]TKI62529.1 hypothetical protein FC770_09100 [Nocardioides jishulii]